MGFIPLPEMTNIGDTRDNERKILLCRRHYFEDKEKCFYVVPFNRDDDPVDNFLTRVRWKHNRIRNGSRLKFNPPRTQAEESLEPVFVDIKPKRLVRNSRKTNKKAKIHFRESNRVPCGVPVASVDSTTDDEFVTCKNCQTLMQQALKQESVQV